MPETVDPEVLADAINVIELLQSMYYGENEFAFSNEQEKELFEILQNDGSESVQRDRLLDSLQVEISLPVGTEQEPVALVITCQVSLLSNTYTLSISSSSNPWLSRDDHERLTSCLKQYAVEANDRASQILETMQFIQQTTEPIAEATIQKRKEASLKTATKQDESSARFLREWIWFPMIYTREKRGHIVDWAPKYSITGFLCPGKPGALCLEGPEKNVAKFINDIKTISWSDIPASHRKMSTKWQERFECTSSAELERKRLFKDMSEVTFNLHGAFGNHNDLSMLQSWMQEKGCGDAFDHLFE